MKSIRPEHNKHPATNGRKLKRELRTVPSHYPNSERSPLPWQGFSPLLENQFCFPNQAVEQRRIAVKTSLSEQ
jgi:hypothetical protein